MQAKDLIKYLQKDPEANVILFEWSDKTGAIYSDLVLAVNANRFSNSCVLVINKLAGDVTPKQICQNCEKPVDKLHTGRIDNEDAEGIFWICDDCDPDKKKGDQ